jgi:hypothetical protein
VDEESAGLDEDSDYQGETQPQLGPAGESSPLDEDQVDQREYEQNPGVTVVTMSEFGRR